MPWKTANTTKVSSSAVVTGTQKRLHVVPARRLQSRPCSAVTTARARHSSHPMVALLASRLHTGFQCKHSHRARSARDCARGRTILITQMLWIKSYITTGYSCSCTPHLALHNRSLSSDKSKGVKQLIFAKQTIQGCRSAVHSVTHSERSCHRSGDDC